VRGGGALPAAQLRCLGVTHEMLVAPAEQVWDDPAFVLIATDRAQLIHA
jgi:hypothetical protein